MRKSLPKAVQENSKFQRWKQRVEANGNTFQHIELLALVSRNSHNPYGMLLDSQIQTSEGKKMPRCVLIRGEGVVIVPVLICEGDGEIYTLLVEQHRIVDGSCSVEFPAGGVEGELKQAAAQELQEELHLTVPSEELLPLSKEPIRMAPSILGDLVHFFYFTRHVSESFLQKIEGQMTGVHEDQEYLTVRVYKMSEIANLSTGSVLVGLKLVEKALNRIF